MRADSPIFHQKQSGAYFTPSDVARELVSWALRVPSFVAFLAYCLHVTLRARLRPLAAGLTPRAVLDKLAAIQMLDVHFPTTNGRTLILSRYTEPNVDQKLLLRQLGLTLPPQAAAANRRSCSGCSAPSTPCSGDLRPPSLDSTALSTRSHPQLRKSG